MIWDTVRRILLYCMWTIKLPSTLSMRIVLLLELGMSMFNTLPFKSGENVNLLNSPTFLV